MWHPNKLFGQWHKHEYKFDYKNSIETQTASFSVFGGMLIYIWRKDILFGKEYLVQFEWVNPNTQRQFCSRVRLDENLLSTSSQDICLEYLKKCAYEVIGSVVLDAVDTGNER